MKELVDQIHKSGTCKDPVKLVSIRDEGIRLGLFKQANLSCGNCVWDMICKMKNYYDREDK